MKFIDINREFTAAASSYMAQGYYINAGTMGGSQGELNGPWSNAACIGYCVMAMRNAGLSEKTQRKVLDELTRCFDDVSVEDAAQMKF